MKREWVIWLIAILFTLSVAGVVGYGFWYVNHGNQTVKKDTSSDNSNDTSSASSAGQGGSSSLQLQSQQAANSSSNSISLQDNAAQQSSGSSSSSSGPTQTKQAPGPETFAQYDKYKDATTIYYGDILVGTGDPVVAGKKVTVTYKGWLTDGQLFDQTTTKPFIFTVGNHEVIQGWDDGLVGMKVGGSRRLIVSPALGYGAQGKNPVPPNAVMVFDIKLLSIQ